MHDGVNKERYAENGRIEVQDVLLEVEGVMQMKDTRQIEEKIVRSKKRMFWLPQPI